MEHLVERLILIQHLRESEAFATMGRVAGGVLHEIRGAVEPLARAADLLDQQLERGIDPDMLQQQLRSLSKHAHKITKLARTDLEWIQKERRERIAVNTAVRHIVQIMRSNIDNKDLELEYYPAPVNLIMNLSPPALEQPLINLLHNAIYHVGKRSWGLITVRVEVHADDADTSLYIRVLDNGYGMTAEQQAHLFTPRVSAKGIHGVGMGLYVSRNLLRSIGGDLELEESIRWLGCGFRIRLPVRFSDMQKKGKHT